MTMLIMARAGGMTGPDQVGMTGEELLTTMVKEVTAKATRKNHFVGEGKDDPSAVFREAGAGHPGRRASQGLAS